MQKIRVILEKLKNDKKVLSLSILGMMLTAAISTAIIVSTSKKDMGVSAIPQEPQNLTANESNSQSSYKKSITVDEKTTDTNASTIVIEPKPAEKTDQQTNSIDTKSATNANSNTNTGNNANTNTNTNTANTTPEPEPTSFTYGNSSGNLTNGATVASDGQYIYYLNSSDGYKLYKISPDGSSKSKISDTVCSSLNIVGDWIYYIDVKGIYKMKKDGSCKTLIDNPQNMGIAVINIAVVNNWVYYLERGSAESQEHTLYKIKTDGTSKTKINFGSNGSLVCLNPENIVVVDGWVYLQMINKAEQAEQLYRIKTDGSAAQKVLNSSPRFYSIADGWIYYYDRTYTKINKAKVDGSSESVLYTIPDTHYSLYSINVFNGYIYFTNYVESEPKDQLGIYKIKIDGSGLTKLVTGSARFLNIAADWIYFEAPGSSLPTYSNGVFTVTIGGSSQILKLKTDGSQLLQVN